jgi:putative ABC transport system ATP-binding protein
MENLVELENVSREYRLDHSHVTALAEVTLRVAAGEFLAVAGPSGSGKSTLLNLIGCLDRPSGGRIAIGNIEVMALKLSQLAAFRRERLGFVFQTFNLIPVFTAWENVEYPLLLRRMPQQERRRRVQEALESVGLAERARHRPDLLSGGERQRVAVARAIVHRPALVLADEPTANLDTANATHLIELMHDLNRRLGLTFIFSTHDQRLLQRAGRVVRLCDGRLADNSAQEGSDGKVLVAGF